MANFPKVVSSQLAVGDILDRGILGTYTGILRVVRTGIARTRLFGCLRVWDCRCNLDRPLLA